MQKICTCIIFPLLLQFESKKSKNINEKSVISNYSLFHWACNIPSNRQCRSTSCKDHPLFPAQISQSFPSLCVPLYIVIVFRVLLKIKETHRVYSTYTAKKMAPRPS